MKLPRCLVTHEFRDSVQRADGYVVICSCGWHSSPSASSGVAYRDWRNHQQDQARASSLPDDEADTASYPRLSDLFTEQRSAAAHIAGLDHDEFS